MEQGESKIERGQSSTAMEIAVLGGGSGGQAFAGYFASKNHNVRLYNRSMEKLIPINKTSEIRCSGSNPCRGKIVKLTDNIVDAIAGAELIMVTTTADAHKFIAAMISDHLADNQVIVLNPGRTGGALEFRAVLKRQGCRAAVFVAESQSLLFACRAKMPGLVKIIGIKNEVPVAAYPAVDIDKIMNKLQLLHPAFCAVENILHTSLNNVGSIFHSGIIIFNAAAIDRAAKFYFYQDITPAVTDFLLELDQERLALGNAFGIKLLSLAEWILKAYPNTPGNNLYEMMSYNPAYHRIKAPNRLDTRYFTEDIPTGLIPLIAFGEAAGQPMPIMRSLVNLSSVLLKRNFWGEGRTLEKMGLGGKSPSEIIAML